MEIGKRNHVRHRSAGLGKYTVVAYGPIRYVDTLTADNVFAGVQLVFDSDSARFYVDLPETDLRHLLKHLNTDTEHA